MKPARLAALIAFAASAFAQPKPQAQDEEFAKLVKEWTTRPEFMSPLVDHLPKAAGVPTPKDVLGYYIGQPKKLTRVADISKYYRALAAATKRVKVLPAGKTDEGRECLVAVISDEENIRNLDTHKANLARLADPRALTDPEARRIVEQSRPIYMLTGGLHSGETGPPEMLMELAYRLAVEETPLFESIRKNVIVMVNNSSDPDGRDRYVDWYYRYMTTQETEQDRAPGPPYWGKYIFHDNNRDINYSQVTMRNWLQFYLEWHPPIMHDLHESQPLLYTFSGQAPQNPTLDPILYGELPWFSNFEMTKLISYGMPGVWTHAFVDMWSPGYLGFMSSNHNGMLRMYETFGNGGANTLRRNIAPTPEGGPEGGRGGRGGMTAREWYRPVPAPREVLWSMRNNTNYMQTGVLAALELTANFSKTVLDNFYQKSRNSVRSGETEAPFGYVLPASQPDMTRVAFVVNALRMQGIEVGRASAEVKLKEGTFPAGSLIVKRNQPYGRLAKILLEKQSFPEGNLTTYDDTGWTMGLMSHAEVKEIADKAILEVKTQPVETLEITGTVKGDGPLLAVLHNGSNHLVTLRFRLKEIKFEAIEKAAKAGDTELPAGSLLVENSARIRSEIAKLGLQAVAMAKAPEVAKHVVDLPRIAMFSTWGSTQEVGWVRYAFDRFEMPYDLIYKERVRKGNLRGDYDVLVVPNQGRGSAKGLVFDIDPKPGRTLAYKKDAEYPTLGMYGESDDISGGMGLAGVAEIDKFVNQGGLLITMGSASFLPAEMGITRSVDAGRTSPQFYAPGPIVQAQILRSEHPMFYGYRGTMAPVRWANGPLLRVPTEERSRVLMQFVGTDQAVLSGLMRGVAETRNRPAAIDMEVGTGHVILFATNPAYRWQNLGEFNMLANSILHFNDLPKPPPARPAATPASGQ
jgi:hypothetical protein